jgi:hypothetical protein
MVAQLLNAAPMTILNGLLDDSETQPVIQPEQLPSHLPKFYIYAQQGPLDDQLVGGDSMTQMYGSASFDLRGPWATHATVGVNAVNAQANQIILRRLQPADAPKPAGIRLSLDVLGPVAVPQYQRGTNGQFLLDNTGKPIPVTGSGATVQGYIAKWVTGPIPNDQEGNDTFGQGVESAGDQTDVTTTTQSKRYPIMDFEVSSFGSWGNNQAIRLYAPTISSPTPIDQRILTQELVYPFRLAFSARPNAITSTSVVPTLQGGQYVDFCFVPLTIDQNTDAQLYLGDVAPASWQSLNVTGQPNQYSPFGQVYSYDSTIATLVEQFYTAELPYIANEFSDFTGIPNEQNLFNFFSGVSSQNVPYSAFAMNTTDANAVQLTPNTNLFATGGGDGTMNETLFAPLVGTAIQADYLDPNSVYNDMAEHPESIFYDTGFPTAVKNQLTAFISNRKDTFLVLATHDVLGPALTAAQETSLALALKTALQLYPESEVYGTPCVRGMIVGRSGTFIGSQYTKLLPLSIEVAIKSAKYMGAGNGIWKSTYNFDRAPNSQVEYFSNINVTFTSATQRNTDWSNGLVWVQAYARKSYFFPALKTVYDDDTSVLNSYFTALIACELEKIGFRSWTQFSGESSLTDAQLCSQIDAWISNAVLGRFDGRVVVQSQTTVTGADAQRGYSWTTIMKMYANNMRTVAQITIDSNRMAALAQTSTSATA